MARQSVPVIGPQVFNRTEPTVPTGESWWSPRRWQVAVGYRYQHSHRHFVGSVEQKNRERDRTEVNNKIHILDVTATYDLSPRWSLSLSVPLFLAERFSERTPDQVFHARGIGDISLGAQVWLLRPPTESRQNIAFGFGVKLPTGNPGVRDTVNTATGPQTRVVDQSIQPGDGGYGFSLSLQGYKGIGFATLYGSGVYLFNPRGTNGVLTGRSRASEAVMSVADQYLYRAGAVFPFPKVRSTVLSFGVRGEGIPVRDAFGKSEGFRRPGVAVSLDPGVIFTRGKSTWSFNVPVAVYRNRKRSVSDIIDGRHGDAAFADYLILVSYSRRF